MYMKEQWATAKKDFLATVQAAIAAKKTACASIKAQCGQTITEEYKIVGEGLKFSSVRDNQRNYCAYDRQAILGASWGIKNIDIEAHWDVTLSQVIEETKAISKWTVAEEWEAAWATLQ